MLGGFSQCRDVVGLDLHLFRIETWNKKGTTYLDRREDVCPSGRTCGPPLGTDVLPSVQFQTFAERLAVVNVDVARRVQRLAATPEDADTFFGESLRKWSELNYTQHFVDFRHEVAGTVFSFAQLIHHQKKIVGALLKHLQVPDSLAYQPLLDLVVQVARDLQSDFYVYFEEVLPVLVSLLQVHHHDTTILEQTFTCLSYLFKFLWRAMVSNIKHVYRLVSPLLSNQYREYINNFAAESFAFLMRKVKHISELCDLMFEDLRDHPDQVSGVGRLLFESMKGVQKGLHSSTAKMLPVVLEKLGSESLPADQVCDCLRAMFDSIAAFTDKDNTEPVWTPLLSQIREVHKRCTVKGRKSGQLAASVPTTAHTEHLRRLLELLTPLVRYKKGLLVLPVNDLTEILIVLLSDSPLPEQVGELLLLAVSALVMAERVSLTFKHQAALLQLVYASSYSINDLVTFTRSVLHMPMFEKDVLPPLMVFCAKCLTEKGLGREAATHLLAELVIHKAPPPAHGEALEAYTTYLLDFGSLSNKYPGSKAIPGALMKQLKTLTKKLTADSLPSIWAIVLTIPHIRPLEAKACTDILRDLLNSLPSFAMDADGDTKDAALCVYADAVLALIQKQDTGQFFSTVTPESITSLLKSFGDNVHALRAVAIYFSHAMSGSDTSDMTTEVTSESTFTGVFPHIEKNLSSPQSRIRMLTLQICCQFNLTMPTLTADLEGVEQLGVFRICLEAEKVAVSVQTYRTKLMHLQKLEHGTVQNQLPAGPYDTVALRYLIGQLYINFTLMWEPVIQLIRSHAVSLKATVFWPVYESHLKDIADITEAAGFFLDTSRKATTRYTGTSDVSALETSTLEEFFQHHRETMSSPDRPDHFNFRKLLWQAMQAFPEVSEPRSKIIVTLFFRFLEKEFYPANQAIAPTQNVGKKEEQGEEDEDDDEEEEEVVEVEKVPVKKKRRQKSKQRPYNSILVTHLGVFAKFRGPKGLYEEQRLRELYYELLPHRSPDVQKVAFQCIMTYKNKSLLPYKDNLEKLMDDKTFKNEIVLFSIDQEANVLHDDHRAEVLPVVIAIIYGKMQTKTGKDTGGRANANVRRSIVFRFLAGCQQHELQIFFDLIFKPVSHYIKDDICAMVLDTIEHTDVSQVVPLKKQQSLLTTVDIILQKLGSLIDDYLPNILRVLVGILAQVSSLLDNRKQLAPRPLTLLKSIRVAVITRLNQFFSTYRTYPFSQDEIQMIFKVAVWPTLELLPKEGIHSPTGLLNLFLTWSQHTRYFDLFRKRWLEESEFCVLPMVVSLLNNKSASPKVIDVIMDIVYNLVTRHEEEEQEKDDEDREEQEGTEEEPMEEPSLDVGDVVELGEEVKDYPLGVQILMLHVPTVLDYIHKVVDDMLKQKGRSKTLPIRVLNVLARLSEYVTDSAQCARMLALLLPFLNRNLNRSVDVELSILKAVQHMVKLTPEPTSCVRTLAKMFSNVSARPSRAALCDTLQAIAECDSSIKPLADVVSRLNAWDARYVEEPDYLVRLEAYREAQSLVRTLEGDAYVTHLLVILHNTSFFINTVVDMSLRDSASLCVQQLMKELSERPNNTALVNVVVKDALLPEVKAGLKLKSEVARHEYINLLSHLIKLFPNIPVFSDLSSLADADVEADFFANMVHIQLHRRGRAMRRITRMLGQRSFMTETLTAYLLPLVTSYLRDEAYLKQAVIMDAVVETVGSMSQCLPWPQYLAMLKYYLNQLPISLDNQKVMVRVIVAILDGFHYDLKNSEEISATALKAPGVAKEEEKVIAGMETTTETGEDTMLASEADSTTDPSGAPESTEDKPGEEDEEDAAPKAGPARSTLGSVTVCSPGLATRIHRILIKVVIPQLHQSLTKKVKSDDEHKKAKTGTYAEDEEVLRVPIALALVKLMQSLPHKTLDFNLPGLLFKLCVFLRSRALDIRNTARDTLLKIMKTLGPSYFSYVLKELRFTLKRGYQLHVLCFSTHMLLKSLEGVLSCGDLESSVLSLVEVFNQEIFGAMAEEKNVIGITSKLMEAKSTKSYESYAILSKFISKGSLVKVFSPLKSILESTTSHKTAGKVEDILHKIIPGLLANTSLEIGDLMTFTFGLTTEVMPLLAPKKKNKKEVVVVNEKEQPKDTYIVQPLPSRAGIKAKTQLKTNMHILVEFGLQVLHSLLKHSTLNHKTLEHAKLLDPFVPALSKCLTAKYAKVTSVALRCLIWVFKFPLPSLKSHIKQISNALFILLRNYAVAGAATSGDNLELIDTSFKAVTVLVRDVEYYTIKADELKVLLSYAEQDIHDHTRQATAFSILKAILSRKLVVPEMHDVMRKIEELSITAHDAGVRQNCRQVTIKFLLNYPLGARLEQHLEFFVSQLEYEHDTGRQSALEMLVTMFEAFPPKLLHQYSALFFVPLASQLVNDDSAKCRRQAALAMKQLLIQLETEKRDELFSMIKQWFEDDKVALRKLAALACGVMVEVETTKFERHLPTVITVLEEQICSERHSSSESGEERQVDHLLYSLLTLLAKLVRLCNLTRRQRWASQLSTVWVHVEKLLLYPHVWVRLASAELFGLLLASWAPHELVKLTQKPVVKAPVYLQDNTMQKLHDLCGSFCKQLSSPQLDEALANQVLKNLVYLGKVVRHFPRGDQEENDPKVHKEKKKASKVQATEQDEEAEAEKRASIEWLLSRLCREARLENANTPKEVLKRSCVFKWLAAMALEFGPEGLPPYLPRMLPVLVRELTDKSPTSNEDLQKLGQEVLDLLKKTAGVENFTTQYAVVLKTLVDKRQTRKRERAAELVADPEVAAKRKLKKNLSKQKAKKRKIEDTRPVKRTKKFKFVDV